MSMPGDIDFTLAGIGKFYWGANLTGSVQNGTTPEGCLMDMAEHIVASWYLLGQAKDFPAGALSGSWLYA